MQNIEPAMFYRLKFKCTTCQVHPIRSYTLLAFGARTKYWSLLFLVTVLELPKIKKLYLPIKKTTYGTPMHASRIAILFRL